MKINKRFVSKPREIEAYQVTENLAKAHLFDGVPLPEGLTLSSAIYNKDTNTVSRCRFTVVTIHGQHAYVEIGDWVITEPDWIHHYPCKPNIFTDNWNPI